MEKMIRDVPPYWRKRRLQLNLLLLAVCGSLFATKHRDGVLEYDPDDTVVITDGITGAVLAVQSGHRKGGAERRGGLGAEPTRGGGPSRVVFQSSLAFSGGAPVCFTNPPGTSVQTILLATKAAPADLATLIDAPEAARIRVAQYDGWILPAMSAVEQSLTGQLTTGTGEFTDRGVVVEVCFQNPVPLASLTFGDSGVRPEWGRLWRGEIKGVVCFDAPLDNEDVRAGVSNWLALRGKFEKGHPYAATSAQRQAALEAGLKSGVDWATVIVIR